MLWLSYLCAQVKDSGPQLFCTDTSMQVEAETSYFDRLAAEGDV